MEPETPLAVQSEILTVMFIDIVGYTSKTARLNRELFNHLHDIFDALSLPIFERYGGTVIKKIGDAFLITFKSPTNAVLCGVELQNTFHQYNNRESVKDPLHIRVAIHTGEVVLRDGDVYGDAVNTAARIEGVAKAGHIVFSEAVFLAMNRNEVPFIHLGLQRFKGVEYPIRLFRVKGNYDIIIQQRRRKKRRIRKIKLFFLKLIVAVILVAILYGAWSFVNDHAGLIIE